MKDMIIEGLGKDQGSGSTDNTEIIVEIEKDTEIIDREIEKDKETETEIEKETDKETETVITKTITAAGIILPYLQCHTQVICQTIVVNFILRFSLYDSSFFNESLWTSWIAIPSCFKFQ